MIENPLKRRICITVSVLLFVCSIYVGRVAWLAKQVVRAVEAGPILEAVVDFSEPFTNEFRIKTTIRPMYGTMYLAFEATPWPDDWTDREAAREDLRDAGGEMTLMNDSGEIMRHRKLSWFYWRDFRKDGEKILTEDFFGYLPLGEYRVSLRTSRKVPMLEKSTQRLTLHYDRIHEGSIARVFGWGSILMMGASILLFFWATVRKGSVTHENARA